LLILFHLKAPSQGGAQGLQMRPIIFNLTDALRSTVAVQVALLELENGNMPPQMALLGLRKSLAVLEKHVEAAEYVFS